jgi:hypothetical protein
MDYFRLKLRIMNKFVLQWLICATIGFVTVGKAQNQALKLYAYKQVNLPGIIKQGEDITMSESGAYFAYASFFIYVKTKTNVKPTIKSVNICGMKFEVISTQKVKSPVVLNIPNGMDVETKKQLVEKSKYHIYKIAIKNTEQGSFVTNNICKIAFVFNKKTYNMQANIAEIPGEIRP